MMVVEDTCRSCKGSTLEVTPAVVFVVADISLVVDWLL